MLSRVLGQRPDTLLLARSIWGLESWLLYQPRDVFAPDPPCIRSTSIEPCHLTSPSQGCDAEWGTDSGKVEQNTSPHSQKQPMIQFVWSLFWNDGLNKNVNYFLF